MVSPFCPGRGNWRAYAAAAVCSVLLSGCVGATSSTAQDAASSSKGTPVGKSHPTPIHRGVVKPVSWLDRATLLTIYGRSFGVAPILGRLGINNSIADFTNQVRPFWQGIHANNGGKRIKIAIHLIYGLAKPCDSNDDCVIYLDDTGVDIVKTYIKPAAQHGWLVILDSQLGRSNPAAEIRHIIGKGYLKYDNVQVAVDPEFRAAPDQPTPGIPVGSITAGEINAAQTVIDRYQRARHPAHRTIMMVHEFQDGMIEHRERIWNRFEYVDTVIDADGFGSPATKADVYTTLMGPHSSAGVKWRALKLFYPNPYENTNHSDVPVLTWRQVFGRAWVVEGGRQFSIWPEPSVIVVA